MTISTAIIFAVIAIGALALIFGLVLGYASIRFKVEGDPLVEQIDAAHAVVHMNVDLERSFRLEFNNNVAQGGF